MVISTISIVWFKRVSPTSTNTLPPGWVSAVSTSGRDEAFLCVHRFRATPFGLPTSLFGLQATPAVTTRLFAFSSDPTGRATTGQVDPQARFTVYGYLSCDDLARRLLNQPQTHTEIHRRFFSSNKFKLSVCVCVCLWPIIKYSQYCKAIVRDFSKSGLLNNRDVHANSNNGL